MARLQEIRFDSGDNRLAGHLFTPDDPGPHPGVVVTGSWTTVKEQMADLYARRLADVGFAALTFDFSNFGKSGGEPREYEDPDRKIADITGAARWLAGRDEVAGSSVGALAICASAGYVAHAIARGAPIGRFATVAAWLHDQRTVGSVYGGEEGVRKKIADGEDALRRFEERGEVLYVPAYSESDPKAAMGEMVKPYYGDPSLGAIPEWNNRFAVMSWPGWLRFDGLATAAQVTAPTLMIHSEDAAFPDNVRRFAEALPTPAEIVWSKGGQLDFYHAPAQVDPAVERVAAHLRFEDQA